MSDYSIRQHILTLYSSSVTRLPGSTELWYSYINHILSTSRSSPEISRVLARALNLQPTKASIWLLAIRFEADGTSPNGDKREEGGIGGGNMDAARKLAMRGIRFMKGATKDDARRLWVEWVRLEVSFVERLRKRWEILGVKDAMAGKPNMEVDLQLDALATLVGDAEDQVSITEQKIVSAKESSPHSALLEGTLIKIVMNNAIAAFPGDVAIYEDLLAVLRPMPTILRPALLSHLYELLRSSLSSLSASATFGSKLPIYHQARFILARRFLDDLASVQKDGTSLKAVSIDSLKWIEAVGESVKEFRIALQETSNGSNELVHEDFARFLTVTAQKTEDASLVGL